MSEITIATYYFLDALDKSETIKNLTKYKNKLLKNNLLLKDIKETQKEKDNKILITKRKEIYSNPDYQMYMKYYNELSMIIMRINKQYMKYTKEHNCHE